MDTKDILQYIANLADDATALRLLASNKNLYNDKYFHLVFGKRYPDLIKYREENETLKHLYLRNLKYIGKLKDFFGATYRNGDPKEYYDILSGKINLNDPIYKEADPEDYPELLLLKKITLTAQNDDRKLMTQFIQEAIGFHIRDWWLDVIYGAALGNNINLINEYYSLYGASYMKKMMSDAGMSAAAESDNRNLVDFFTQKGGDLNVGVYAAFEVKNYDMLSYLLDKGADLDPFSESFKEQILKSSKKEDL